MKTSTKYSDISKLTWIFADSQYLLYKSISNLRYKDEGNLSAENNSNCQETNPPLKIKMVVLICCFIKFIYVDAFEYVSTQEFEGIVSETFNIEKTHMQFSHELL